MHNSNNTSSWRSQGGPSPNTSNTSASGPMNNNPGSASSNGWTNQPPANQPAPPASKWDVPPTANAPMSSQSGSGWNAKPSYRPSHHPHQYDSGPQGEGYWAGNDQRSAAPAWRQQQAPNAAAGGEWGASQPSHRPYHNHPRASNRPGWGGPANGPDSFGAQGPVTSEWGASVPSNMPASGGWNAHPSYRGGNMGGSQWRNMPSSAMNAGRGYTGMEERFGGMAMNDEYQQHRRPNYRQQQNQQMGGNMNMNMNMNKDPAHAMGLYLLGFPGWVKVRNLYEVFGLFGEIRNAGIIFCSTQTDQHTRYYAYIDFMTPGSAAKAMTTLSNRTIFNMSNPITMHFHFDANPTRDPPFVTQNLTGTPIENLEDPDLLTLHIKNLPLGVNKAEVNKFFSGLIASADGGNEKTRRCDILPLMDQNKSVGFISFYDADSAKRALTKLDEKMKEKEMENQEAAEENGEESEGEDNEKKVSEYFFGMKEKMDVELARVQKKRSRSMVGGRPLSTSPNALMIKQQQQQQLQQQQQQQQQQQPPKQSGGEMSPASSSASLPSEASTTTKSMDTTSPKSSPSDPATSTNDFVPRSIYIENLPETVDPAEFITRMAKYGDIQTAAIIPRKGTNPFAIVVYYKAEDTEDVFSKMSGRYWFGMREPLLMKHPDYTSIYIRNIPIVVTQQQCFDWFNTCGPINDVRILSIKEGKDTTIAFVDFGTPEAATRGLILAHESTNPFGIPRRHALRVEFTQTEAPKQRPHQHHHQQQNQQFYGHGPSHNYGPSSAGPMYGHPSQPPMYGGMAMAGPGPQGYGPEDGRW